MVEERRRAERQCLEQAVVCIERLRRANELMEAELSGYRAIAALVRGIVPKQTGEYEEDIAWAIRRMLALKPDSGEEECEDAAIQDGR